MNSKIPVGIRAAIIGGVAVILAAIVTAIFQGQQPLQPVSVVVNNNNSNTQNQASISSSPTVIPTIEEIDPILTPSPLLATSTNTPISTKTFTPIPTNTPISPTPTFTIIPTNTPIPPTSHSSICVGSVTRREVDTWSKVGSTDKATTQRYISGNFGGRMQEDRGFVKDDTVPSGVLIATDFGNGESEVYLSYPVKPVVHYRSWGLFETTESFIASYLGACLIIAP